MAIANYRYKLHIINIPHSYIMCYKFELIMFEILLNLSQNNKLLLLFVCEHIILKAHGLQID